MVIKIPIYVEIDTIDERLLPLFVDAFAILFFKQLRKEEFTKDVARMQLKSGSKMPSKIKIISKDMALETLRIKK